MESNNNHDTAIAAAVILSISCVQQVYAKYTYTVIYMYTYISLEFSHWKKNGYFLLLSS